jgi:hypothetical protein
VRRKKGPEMFVLNEAVKELKYFYATLERETPKIELATRFVRPSGIRPKTAPSRAPQLATLGSHDDARVVDPYGTPIGSTAAPIAYSAAPKINMNLTSWTILDNGVDIASILPNQSDSWQTFEQVDLPPPRCSDCGAQSTANMTYQHRAGSKTRRRIEITDSCDCLYKKSRRVQLALIRGGAEGDGDGVASLRAVDAREKAD